MRKSELKLTSVKVYKPLIINSKYKQWTKSLSQKLVNRCMDMYMNDKSFRNKIFEHTNLALSGV